MMTVSAGARLSKISFRTALFSSAEERLERKIVTLPNCRTTYRRPLAELQYSARQGVLYLQMLQELFQQR